MGYEFDVIDELIDEIYYEGLYNTYGMGTKIKKEYPDPNKEIQKELDILRNQIKRIDEHLPLRDRWTLRDEF